MVTGEMKLAMCDTLEDVSQRVTVAGGSFCEHLCLSHLDGVPCHMSDK
jgi:hypothetical protein